MAANVARAFCHWVLAMDNYVLNEETVSQFYLEGVEIFCIFGACYYLVR